jgi:hypothetical protein
MNWPGGRADIKMTGYESTPLCREVEYGRRWRKYAKDDQTVVVVSRAERGATELEAFQITA